MLSFGAGLEQHIYNTGRGGVGRGGPTPDVPSCFLWPRQGRRLLAWYLLGVALGRSLRAFLPHKLLAGLGCGATEMKG